MTYVVADIAPMQTTQQKENKSFIILDAKISSIDLIVSDFRKGSKESVESYYVAELSDVFAVKDKNKILDFRKVASYRLYFMRNPDPLINMRRVPKFEVGDKVRVYLTDKTTQFIHREVLIVVNTSDDLEVLGKK